MSRVVPGVVARRGRLRKKGARLGVAGADVTAAKGDLLNLSQAGDQLTAQVASVLSEPQIKEDTIKVNILRFY